MTYAAGLTLWMIPIRRTRAATSWYFPGKGKNDCNLLLYLKTKHMFLKIWRWGNRPVYPWLRACEEQQHENAASFSVSFTSVCVVLTSYWAPYETCSLPVHLIKLLTQLWRHRQNSLRQTSDYLIYIEMHRKRKWCFSIPPDATFP